LDVLLVSRGLFPSREKAKASIMAGIVSVNGQMTDKAGTPVPDDAIIEIKENLCPFVGRGGLKLAKALNEFNLDVTNKVAMDIGASTGGFTDCLLQNGAKKVYAIDVGYGHLDYSLRKNPQVINMEKTNIRYLDYDLILDPIEFISIDVSFISLTLVLPVAGKLLENDGQMVCLVKPQFEAGKDQVGKGGIVKDKDIHIQVIEKVISSGRNQNLKLEGLTFSPVKGAKGNIEYLLLFRKTEEADLEFDVLDVVLTAQEALNLKEKRKGEPTCI
jgi:23S rRNA (cytidine1920-2'-O)/16S rRNA (cytidine1409-2'-O)-methyltransferase